MEPSVQFVYQQISNVLCQKKVPESFGIVQQP